MILLKLILTLLFFTSCISPSTQQSARTLQEGKSAYSVEVSRFSQVFLEQSTHEKKVTQKLENIAIPFVAIGFNHSFHKKNELGFQLGFPGTLNLNLKQNFYNGDQYSFALSLGLGFIKIKFKHLFEEQEYKVYDTSLSLINTCDIDENISLSLIANLIQRSHQIKRPLSIEKEQNFFSRIDLGINFKYFYIKHNFIVSPNHPAQFARQISFGYWSGWNKTDKL